MKIIMLGEKKSGNFDFDLHNAECGDCGTVFRFYRHEAMAVSDAGFSVKCPLCDSVLLVRV